MIVDVEIVVDRPRTEVFDAMADARNEPSWNSQVSKCELVTEPPIGEKTTFTTVNRGRPYAAEITTYERPERLTYEVTGSQLTIVGAMEFAEVDGATRLTARFDMAPRAVMKVLMPMMGPAIRRDFPKQFSSFKAFCESR
jgi:uncharacterized protein YndB with AHSA1/START domain